MNRRLNLWFTIALLAGGALLSAAESLRIVPIVSVDDVLVSFELVDAYTQEVREAISSGLRTTFTYDVELRMVGPLWVDRTVARVLVSTHDEYDNLTRRHALQRAIDGHVEAALVTEDDSVVGPWLTTFARLPLCKTSRLDASREYYVRVSARSRPQGASFLGWASTVTGRTKFTFIP
jgi:hypothetical protein